MKLYQHYLEHIYQQVPIGDPLQQFARGYEDYLQCPLQPLMDNLESQTYEVFEKDPVKYAKYEEAMTAAMTDMIAEGDRLTKELVVIVVGAGRGWCSGVGVVWWEGGVGRMQGGWGVYGRRGVE